VSIDEKLISIPARYLDPPPTIQYNGIAESAIKTPDKASLDLKQVRFKDAKGLGDLYLLNLSGQASPEVQPIVDIFTNTVPRHGMNMTSVQPMTNLTINDQSLKKDQFATALTTIRATATQAQQTPFLLIILPDKDKQLYTYIKCIADIAGLPHVCCNFKNGKVMAPQYHSNVMLKANYRKQGVAAHLHDEAFA